MKKEKYSWDNVTLVLIGGGEIELEIRSDMLEEIWEDLMSDFGTNSIWFCGNWDLGILEVSYCGGVLDYVDFKKIVGMRS